jgi:hypothetical protein
MMKIIAFVMTLIMLSSTAYGSCYRNQYGRVVCNNGEGAGGYNRRTGTAWKSEKNQYGVATTQTSKGGTAKTKNGKGVYEGPNGKKCYKTANRRGCN